MVLTTAEHSYEAGCLIRKIGKEFPKDSPVMGIKFAIMLVDAKAGTVTKERAAVLKAWVPSTDDIAAFWRGYNAA